MQKCLPVVLLLTLAGSAARADIAFNDPLAWLGAATAPITTVNFEGLAPAGGFTFVGSGAGANTTVGGINFAVGPLSNGDLFIAGDDYYYPGTAAISSQQSTTPFNDLLITLPSPVGSLGFFFGDFFADTATIRLSDGTVALPTAIAYPYLGFFGVTRSPGVTWADITTPDPAMNVASVSFGPVSSTPEPSSSLLVGTALVLGLVALRKRFHRLSGNTPIK